VKLGTALGFECTQGKHHLHINHNANMYAAYQKAHHEMNRFQEKEREEIRQN
jgi:hypothetical protein